MGKEQSYAAKTMALLEEIRAGHGLDFRVLKVEYVREEGQYYLRVYCDVDQPGGIGSEDCAKIARPLSKALDKADFIEDDNYTLEVCSPGFLVPAQEGADEKTETEEDAVSEDQEENDHE